MQAKNISPKQTRMKMLLSNLSTQINWLKSVDSTNKSTKEYLTRHDYTRPLIFASDKQTAGYGKQERKFISDTGGIYLTLAIKIPQLTFKNQGLLTTGIAWALYQTIQEHFGITTEIKWVNDLLLNGKKVAGILVERVKKQIAVIGIGCNLYQPELESKLPTGANLLKTPLSDEQICQFTAKLVRSLLKLIPNFTSGTFLPAYKEHLALLNKEVTIQLGKTTITGKAIDINSQANLIIQTATGCKTISAGEVTKIRQT